MTCLLIADEKDICVNIRLDLFDLASANKNFLKNIIIGDEAWVYGYDEIKMKLLQLLEKRSP